MRFVRSSFVASLFAAALLAIASPGHAAPAGLLPDTTGILTPWRLEPASPCVQDSVYMIVRGFVATACDSFLSAEAIDSLRVRIRTQVYGDRFCFAPPLVFYPVPVGLGRFGPGPHAGIVEVVTVNVREDGSSTRAVQEFRFDFDVAPDCPAPPPPPAGPLPYVHAIVTDPAHPCAGKPTTLVMEGAFRDGCGQVVDAAVYDPEHVEITLQLHTLEQRVCTHDLKPWRQAFELGALPSGPHRTDITLHVVDVDSTRTSLVRRTYYGMHEFFVFGDCDSVPPPIPGPLPYVEQILIGRPGICGPEPACPGDSILVRVHGVFPNDCFSFRRIQLIPRIETVVPLPPPIVRIIVDATGCQRRLCREVPVPWSAEALLPQMMGGDYRLDVELAKVSCSDSYPPGELFRTMEPFAVADSCPAPACLTVDFAPGPGNIGACNATISDARPAELTFLVRPTVALAGLQGEFRLRPSVLDITRIEAIGPAQNMLVEWTPTGEGVRFVLFAPSGAPIPPFPGNSRMVETGGWPVLRITVEHIRREVLPDLTVVTTENVLGSDNEGQGVPLCPPPPCVRADPAYPPAGSAFDPRVDAVRALVCAEHACDFNADGFEDIRDLVTMVRCVNGEIPCPPDAGARFDCNADATFSLPDVICCARHVLLLPPCPECPPDTGQVRPEPGVALSFGSPVEIAGGVDLPLRVDGADRLGAALLTLEAPLERYDLTGLGGDMGGRWLALHEVRGGRIVLGLVSTWSGDFAPDPTLDLTLHLALKSGQTPGGEVSAVGGEFSGGDGVRLAVNLGRPSQGLPGPARLALGGSRPNPFSAETRFTLELAEPADALVGIYDLRGRLMATLFRGRLPSGPREFRWDGRRGDGTAASHGVYFYQVSVGGKTLARKLILMRGD